MVYYGDLRVALYVLYAVLLVWRTSVGDRQYWWAYLLGYIVVSQLTYAAERFVAARRQRKDVEYLRSLDPAEAEERVGRMWSASARRIMTRLLDEEGRIAGDEMVERFPFSLVEQRNASRAFWVFAALSAVCFASLLASALLPRWLEWSAWGAGSVFALGAGWFRHRGKVLASVIEVSRYGLVEVAADGTRRFARWSHPLVLQNEPHKRRVLLRSAQLDRPIVLSWSRVGFERMLRLTVEYGEFGVGAERDRVEVERDRVDVERERVVAVEPDRAVEVAGAAPERAALHDVEPGV